jgi:hypothetical protein
MIAQVGPATLSLMRSVAMSISESIANQVPVLPAVARFSTPLALLDVIPRRSQLRD